MSRAHPLVHELADDLPPAILGHAAEALELDLRVLAVSDLDAHGLRRTAGVLGFAQGFDIFTISRLLGHQSVTTIEKAYVGIADSTLTAAFDQVDGWVATNAATHAATQGGKSPGCNA